MHYYFMKTNRSFSFLTFKNEDELKIYIGQSENDLTIPNVLREILKDIEDNYIEEFGEYSDSIFAKVKWILNKEFNKTITMQTFRFNYFSDELKLRLKNKI